MNINEFQANITNASRQGLAIGRSFGFTDEMEQAIAYLGQTELQQGNFKAAAIIYGGLLAHFNENSFYWGQCAQSFIGNRDYINGFIAFGMAEYLTKDANQSLEYAYHKILALVKGKMYNRAHQYGLETIESYPNAPQNWRHKLTNLVEISLKNSAN